MKITSATDVVIERDGLGSDGAFGIVFNAKMAKILSDGLYSDKIQSIIRELSCNAVDSHVEAGKGDEPIEVHLPTVFEPVFYVRDFGVGLDHEQVIKIYTVYGASTKTNSNEFIGQLGLGSKSPFSYVDAFDVTARKDGVERQYSCYKNEEGMPSIALLSEAPTTERNGVTVQMPVKQEDIRRFAEKAVNVFKWFSVCPRITGVSEFTLPDMKNAWSGARWAIRKKRDSYYNQAANHPWAIMGRVAYPLDAASISGLTDAHRAMLALPLTLEFDIGDLEIAASREALGYDKRTQANIVSRLDDVLSGLAEEFERSMSSAPTLWEAHKLWDNIFGAAGGMRYELEKAFGQRGLMWRGQLITNAHVELDLKDVFDLAVHGHGLLHSTASYKRLRPLHVDSKLTLRCDDHTVVVFNDLPKGGASRAAYYREVKGGHYNIYYFEHTGKLTPAEVVAKLGDCPHVLTSSLPKRPSEQRGERVDMMSFRGGHEKSRSWQAEDVELDNGGVYVDVDRYTVVWNSRRFENFETIVSLARKLNIISDGESVYAPRAGMRKKVAEHADWTNLFDMIMEHIKTSVTPVVLQQVADARLFDKVSRAARDPNLWNGHVRVHHANGAFARFGAEMRALEAQVKAHADTNRMLIELAGIFGTEITLPDAVSPVEHLYDHMVSTYPMVWVDCPTYGPVIRKYKMFVDYVNMVDDYQRMQQDAALDQVKELISA